MSTIENDFLNAIENHIENCVSPAEIQLYKNDPKAPEFEYIRIHIQKCPYCNEIFNLDDDKLKAEVEKALQFDLKAAKNAFKNGSPLPCAVDNGDVFSLRTDYSQGGIIESQIYAVIFDNSDDKAIRVAPISFDIHLGSDRDFYIPGADECNPFPGETILVVASSHFKIRKERLYEKIGRLSEFYLKNLNYIIKNIDKKKVDFPEGVKVLSIVPSLPENIIYMNGRLTRKSIDEIVANNPEVLMTPRTVLTKTPENPVNIFHLYRRLKASLYLKDLAKLNRAGDEKS